MKYNLIFINDEAYDTYDSLCQTEVDQFCKELEGSFDKLYIECEKKGIFDAGVKMQLKIGHRLFVAETRIVFNDDAENRCVFDVFKEADTDEYLDFMIMQRKLKNEGYLEL